MKMTDIQRLRISKGMKKMWRKKHRMWNTRSDKEKPEIIELNNLNIKEILDKIEKLIGEIKFLIGV